MFARFELPAEANLPGDSYRLHPVITDASFRIAEAIFPDEDMEQIHLPFGISGFSCDHAASGTVWVKAAARQQAQTRVVDLELFDDAGDRVATVEQLTLRSVPVFSLKQRNDQTTGIQRCAERVALPVRMGSRPKSPQSKTARRMASWLILRDAGDVAAELAHRLMQAKGQRVHVAQDPGAVDALIKSKKAHSLTRYRSSLGDGRR